MSSFLIIGETDVPEGHNKASMALAKVREHEGHIRHVNLLQINRDVDESMHLRSVESYYDEIGAITLDRQSKSIDIVRKASGNFGYMTFTRNLDKSWAFDRGETTHLRQRVSHLSGTVVFGGEILDEYRRFLRHPK